MRGFLLAISGFFGVVAASVIAYRRGMMPRSVVRGVQSGIQSWQGQVSSRMDQVTSSIDAIQRDMSGGVDRIKSEVESMQRDMATRMDRTRSEVESLRRDVLSKEDQTRSEVESIQHEVDSMEREVGAMHRDILSRLDDIRSQFSKAGVAEKSSSGGSTRTESKPREISRQPRPSQSESKSRKAA